MDWTLALPDWAQLDTVRKSPLPFALWQVGDQPILHHWLDDAVNQGVSSVHILCSDRPSEVRRSMEQAHLWRLEWSLEAVPKEPEGPQIMRVDRLPGMSPEAPPTDGWGLLDRWFALRRHWFEHAPDRLPHFERLALGRFTQIHPTAKIRPPVWFEDYVQVGPNCEVGPYVSLGSGAVLEGPSVVRNAVLEGNTILAGHTELIDAVLDGGRLIHLRHRADIPKLDILIADSLKKRAAEPSTAERIVAGAMYAAFETAARFGPKSTRRVIDSFDGLELEEETEGPLWRRRRTWLKEVARGRMRLWGVLPRSQAQLDALDPEWRQVLSDAPRGVFAFSDLHGSHGADSELEAVHAVFQASSARDAMREVFKENFRRLLETTPEEEDD
ncbi:MAG: hypothetical protein AAGD10_17850 [Myxococcota bacterium]